MEPTKDNVVWRQIAKKILINEVTIPWPDGERERESLNNDAAELERQGLITLTRAEEGIEATLTEKGIEIKERQKGFIRPPHHHHYEKATEPDADGCYTMTCNGDLLGKIRPCRDYAHRDKWEFQVMTTKGWLKWTGHRKNMEKAFDKLREKHENRVRQSILGLQQAEEAARKRAERERFAAEHPEMVQKTHQHQYEETVEPDGNGCYQLNCNGELVGEVRQKQDGDNAGFWEMRPVNRTGHWGGWTGNRRDRESAFDLLKSRHVRILNEKQERESKKNRQAGGYDNEYLRSRKTKAVPYASASSPYENRWAIVDAETGEILDDAQGYGYKSAAGAHRAFGYKTASKEVKRRRETAKRLVERFERKHKSLMDDLDAMSFYAAKDGEEMTDQDILDCFKEHGVNLDDEGFTLKEFLKYW